MLPLVHHNLGIYTYICICICTYTYTNIYMYIHTYMHTYIHVYVCWYVCMYIYVYMYIYMFVYSHTHTHTHTHKQTHQIMIEGCHGCAISIDKITLQTATIEIWRCTNTDLSVDCFVGTLQVAWPYTYSRRLPVIASNDMYPPPHS
jgi:hypothetical protein